MGGAYLGTRRSLMDNIAMPPTSFDSEDQKKQWWERRYERRRRMARDLVVFAGLVLVAAVVGGFV